VTCTIALVGTPWQDFQFTSKPLGFSRICFELWAFESVQLDTSLSWELHEPASRNSLRTYGARVYMVNIWREKSISIKLYKILQANTLMICAIEAKTFQPNRRLSRDGVPMASYTFLATTSKESSTQHRESSCETGICSQSASMTTWSTIIWQSSAGLAGTVNACLGVEPDMLDLSGCRWILWLFQYSTNLSSWFWSIFSHSQ